MKTKARKIVEAVIKDLKGRKGFGNWYDNIDDDIKIELETELEKVVDKLLT